MIVLACDDLGRCIVRRATRGLQEFFVHLQSGHTKISNLDVLVKIKQQVLWLQVAMADVELMQVSNAVDDLFEIVDSLVLQQSAALDQVVKKLTSLDVLKNQIEIVLVFPHVVEAHDVGVGDQLHDDNLALNAVRKLCGI